MKTTYVHLIARLHCRRADPNELVGRAVRLYDADAVSDDFLSSARMGTDGTVEFLFDLAAGRSLDSLFETKPDLYCVISAADGRILYRSAVHENADFLGVDPDSGEPRRTMRIDFREA